MTEVTKPETFWLVFEHSNPDSPIFESRSINTFPSLAEAEAKKIKIEKERSGIKVIGIYDNSDKAQTEADKPLLNPVIVMRLRNAIIDDDKTLPMFKQAKIEALRMAIADAQRQAFERLH